MVEEDKLTKDEVVVVEEDKLSNDDDDEAEVICSESGEVGGPGGLGTCFLLTISTGSRKLSR